MHTLISLYILRENCRSSLTNDIHEHGHSAARNWSTNPRRVARHAIRYSSSVYLHVKYIDCLLLSVFVSISELQGQQHAKSRGSFCNDGILWFDNP